MKWTENSIEVSHADAVHWVEWFLLQQVQRGLPKNEKDRAGFIIMAFLESGSAYATRDQSKIKCPKCGGRGHSNLFLAGADKPTECRNCKGAGFIQPGLPAQ